MDVAHPPNLDRVTVLRTVRVAAIQATPVILDAEASVAKAVRLLGEAAEQGAELAVLPETFVPLYPSNRWAHGAARFLKTYALKMGFLDGAEGLIIAFMEADYAALKYAKLWEIQRKPPARLDPHA